jgi:hypothetical protein
MKACLGRKAFPETGLGIIQYSDFQQMVIQLSMNQSFNNFGNDRQYRDWPVITGVEF